MVTEDVGDDPLATEAELACLLAQCREDGGRRLHLHHQHAEWLLQRAFKLTKASIHHSAQLVQQKDMSVCSQDDTQLHPTWII